MWGGWSPSNNTAPTATLIFTNLLPIKQHHQEWTRRKRPKNDNDDDDDGKFEVSSVFQVPFCLKLACVQI